MNLLEILVKRNLISEGIIESLHKSVVRSVIDFLRSPVKNPIGKRWIENYYQLSNKVKNIQNDAGEEDEYKKFYDQPKPKQKVKPNK